MNRYLSSLIVLFSLCLGGQAWGQGAPSGGGLGVPTPAINLGAIGLTAGATSGSVVNPGTGYVPGDNITLSIPGTVVKSPLGLSYLSNAIAYVMDTQVVSATVATGGTGCSGATATLTGTTGNTAGSVVFFTATAPISGGAITNPVTITSGGQYQNNPSNIASEPVTGSSCSGATLTLVMGAQYIQFQTPGSFSAIPSGSNVAATQASTTGSGTGATFTVNFGAQAAYVIPPSQAACTTFNGCGYAQQQYNLGQGNLALSSVTTGRELTAFGWQALASDTTGAFNTAFGVNALGAEATGSNNTAFGVDASRVQNGASGNTTFGQSAGINLTTGSDNTYVGLDAGQGGTTGGNNVAIGYQACFNGTSGQTFGFNACLGRQSGNALTSGTQNTLVGNSTGHAVTTGSGNIIIGSGSGATYATGSNNALIGAGTNLNCDNLSGTTSNFFGVCSTASAQTWLISGNMSTLAFTFGGTVTAPSLSTSGTIAGSICATSAGLILYEAGATGCTISLRKLKHDIAKLKMDEALHAVMALRPSTFAMNSQPDVHRIGFIAEEAKAADPKFATYDGKSKLQAYDVNGILAATVLVVQKLKADNDNLRADINRLLRKHR